MKRERPNREGPSRPCGAPRCNIAPEPTLDQSAVAALLRASDRVGRDGDATVGLDPRELWTRVGLVHRVVARFGHVVRWIPGRPGRWRVFVAGRWIDGNEGDAMTVVVHTIFATERERPPEFFMWASFSADGLFGTIRALTYHPTIRAGRDDDGGAA